MPWRDLYRSAPEAPEAPAVPEAPEELGPPVSGFRPVFAEPLPSKQCELFTGLIPASSNSGPIEASREPEYWLIAPRPVTNSGSIRIYPRNSASGDYVSLAIGALPTYAKIAGGWAGKVITLEDRDGTSKAYQVFAVTGYDLELLTSGTA